MATLISELLDLPAQVYKGDFVLNLSDVLTQPEVVLRDYVVTPQLADCFDNALGFIRSALDAHPGTAPVFVDLEPRPGFEAVFRVEGLRVRPGPEFAAAVEGIFGAGCLRFGRAPIPAPPRRAWGGG